METRVQQCLKRLSRLQRPFERVLLPVILFLWPFVGCGSGVDLTDTMYSLGNYETLRGGMWYFATFLANVTGRFLMKLPFGSGIAAMQCKAALLVSITVLIVYYTLQHLMPGWMIFIGEIIAVSLSWGPLVILYNTLSYLFLTFGVLCLFLAVTGVPRKRKWYVLAGIFLGLNVFVRFSNLTQAALILAVWFEERIAKRDRKEAWKDTGACAGGFALGAGAVFLLICAFYGAGTYFGAVEQLLHLDGGYTLPEMLGATAAAYITALKWTFYLAAGMFLGTMFFMMPLLSRVCRIKKVLYLAGIAVLIRFFYGRGMFTVNYQDYWCMFEWAMIFILLTVLLDVIFIAGRFAATTDERFLAAVSLILILISPLGSNNYTFPILLNLYVTAPYTLWMFRRIWQETRHVRGHSAWHLMAGAVIAMVIVQGILFHCSYSFRDGTDGTARNAVMSGIPRAEGMHTTPDNARELEQLNRFLQEKGLLEGKVLSMGDIPGISYLYEMEPAISTAWPDLDSFSAEQFAADLDALEEPPLVILKTDPDHAWLKQDQGTADGEELPVLKKAKLLQEYLDRNSYRTIYESGVYTVKERQSS